MRRALAGALLLTAPPALAQHVAEVTETAEGFACRAAALPELRLTHDWRDGSRAATLRFEARERGASDLGLDIAFRPDTALPFGTAASALGFQLDLATPLAALPAAAHLRLDAKPDPVTLLIDAPSRESVTVAVLERQRAELADRLMRTAIVELDLIDASGAPLARYSWDVRKLRRAPALLQLVNWSCR